MIRRSASGSSACIQCPALRIVEREKVLNCSEMAARYDERTYRDEHTTKYVTRLKTGSPAPRVRCAVSAGCARIAPSEIKP